ncbi:MAG: NifU family protein [Cyclobacteriaceae bacterium]
MNLVQKVESALDSIRPYLEADGGNVKVIEITEDNVVKLEMLGACGTCPMSAMTLRAGVEEAIKRAVPEIVSVEAINLASTGKVTG